MQRAAASPEEAAGLRNQQLLLTKQLRDRQSEINQLKKSLRKTRDKGKFAGFLPLLAAQPVNSRNSELPFQLSTRSPSLPPAPSSRIESRSSSTVAMLGLVEPFVHLEWRRVKELVEPLQRAKDTIADLRGQNENLKEQVRVEVERRAKLEAELQDCEKACNENRALREELAELRRAADDADRLVRSSRRLQRQQADQLLAVKAENARLLKANEAIASLEEEVEALRTLVCDKDAAMQRQVRTMEALKELIQRLRQVHPGVNESIDEFFRASTSEEDDWVEEDEDFERRRLLYSRPKSGAVRMASRSSPTRQPRSVSVTSNRSADWDRQPSQAASRASARAETAVRAGSCEPARSASSLAGPPATALGKKRLDAVASLYVQLGSRVTVEVHGKTETGTVKYVGLAHPAERDKVFVGIRLQSQAGNSDGTFRGVRYFTAPSKTGLFVRAHKILSIFNSRKNCQVSMAECVKTYLKLHQ
uniref:CAP-Gly domain-containing protein n=1 Tax=Macrostomum lignano TaxID=282301 RepID=A0A1I8GQ84_9PLAT